MTFCREFNKKKERNLRKANRKSYVKKEECDINHEFCIISGVCNRYRALLHIGKCTENKLNSSINVLR